MKKVIVLVICLMCVLTACKQPDVPSDVQSGAVSENSEDNTAISNQDKTSTNEYETNNPDSGETSTIKTDDSVWYSEEAGVRGRIWLGMTEKELYDVLNKYNIAIPKTYGSHEYDEYGAEYHPTHRYYKKCFYTEGHQWFYFDEDDRLMEICYFDQLHYTDDPVNEEFEAQRGVQRRGTYEDMINAYGQPDEFIDMDIVQSCVYKLDNGDYLHFAYQGTSLPILAIHYCKYPYLYSYLF